MSLNDISFYHDYALYVPVISVLFVSNVIKFALEIRREYTDINRRVIVSLNRLIDTLRGHLNNACTLILDVKRIKIKLAESKLILSIVLF